MPHKLTLAIDTSCDETSVAVTRGAQILSNVVASQAQLHKQYGGVFPTVAKQAHQELLPKTTQAALDRAQVSWPEIDQIAVTVGPGLAPALEVGINFAQDLSHQHHKPLVAVNHIEGHIFSVEARPKTQTTLQTNQPKFPILAVIISGKQSEFYVIKDFGEYIHLGGTIDDAAGEVIDKVGRMLDLGYPAGAVIEQMAKQGDANTYQFPLPMTTSGDYNLSFSGMKTFARNKIEALEAEKPLTKTDIYNFCASFQKAVFRAICYKLNKILATHQFSEVWLGGGVAANAQLRLQLRATLKPYNLKLRTPYTKKLCGDNAAMIGVVAGLPQHVGQNLDNFDRRPRWPLNINQS
jgi:N6-L-threonylcarbamoyladenine synthase